MIIYQKQNSTSSSHFESIIYEDFNFPEHLHRNLEMVYLIEGEMQIKVDNHIEYMYAGNIALIFGNQIHAYHTPSHSKAIVCVFSDDYIQSFLFDVKGKVGKQAVITCDKFVLSYLQNVLMQNNELSKYYLKSAIYAVCAEYIKKVELVEKKYFEESLLHKILSYISDRYLEDITIASMASFLGYESHYISRYFNSVIGMNFRQFINQYRIDFAKHLMEQCSLTITEVALESGFQCVRNFNRVFKELTGVKPSAYKKRI